MENGTVAKDGTASASAGDPASSESMSGGIVFLQYRF
jgi:hypothetical protein